MLSGLIIIFFFIFRNLFDFRGAGHICDRIWEKGPYRANNDFAVRAFLVLPHLKTILGTKLLFLSQSYLPLFAYTHAKFERVEVFLKGQARCLKTAT